MTWEERLFEATYTSPSGEIFTFEYEDVSTEVVKKTNAFQFPAADGTYIQDLGRQGRKLPVRIFFSGGDYDLIANAFEAALVERGFGQLSHPMYGVFNVIPFGAYTRRDNLVSGGNQARFEVTFWESIPLVYPVARDDGVAAINEEINTATEAAAEEFENVVEIDDPGFLSSLKATLEDIVEDVSAAIDAISQIQEDVRARVQAVENALNTAINTFVGGPLTTAFLLVDLLKEPGRILNNVVAKFEAYGGLVDQILNSVFGGSEDRVIRKNNFHANDLTASATIIGLVEGVVNSQFSTQIEALEAAEQILSYQDQIGNWRDDSFAATSSGSPGDLDTGTSFAAMQNLVAVTASYLVEVSFTLRQEKAIEIDRNRTLLDFLAEIYGQTFEDEIDFFIRANNLTGSQILELEKGMTVVYYI